jgi:hypothetical protein
MNDDRKLPFLSISKISRFSWVPQIEVIGIQLMHVCSFFRLKNSIEGKMKSEDGKTQISFSMSVAEWSIIKEAFGWNADRIERFWPKNGFGWYIRMNEIHFGMRYEMHFKWWLNKIQVWSALQKFSALSFNIENIPPQLSQYVVNVWRT